MVSLDFGDEIVVSPSTSDTSLVSYHGLWAGEVKTTTKQADSVTETKGLAESLEGNQTQTDSQVKELLSRPVEHRRQQGSQKGSQSDSATSSHSDDLVSKALRLLEISSETTITRNISVKKNIPAGAGLGGGSADAAALLRAGGFHDFEAAATLGADVAFCLFGKRALVEGIGEKITPLPKKAQCFTIYTPPIHCSTPAVYKRWDEMGGPRGSNGNDLEPAALSLYPQMLEARERLSEHSNKQAKLAGSGSSWYVEGHYPGNGFITCKALLELP